jgi:hypothetical protein
VAGTTSFDSDPSSLNAIQSEWNSQHGYAERIENLTGLFNRTWANRLNGNVFLTPATVQDDGVPDVVYGGGGKDLFEVTLGGPSGDIAVLGGLGGLRHDADDQQGTSSFTISPPSSPTPGAGHLMIGVPSQAGATGAFGQVGQLWFATRTSSPLDEDDTFA